VWWRAVLALVVALSLQIGVNYANDYSDGVRGTDFGRTGPVRLVAGGLASPQAVKAVALASLGVAAAAGLVLALATSLWLLVVGAGCIAAAWFYTGGRRPYGYAGLGEVFVFVFFGVVAVVGTAYVALGRVTVLAVAASVPVGLFSVALLVVNNLRDRSSDAAASKRTLAVRLGDARTRQLYVACIVAALGWTAGLGAFRHFAVLGVLGAVLAAGPLRQVLAGASGRSLVRVLSQTGRAQLVFGVLLTVGIAL
ncbi:MAG: 1,4-dihydroxy-2-naphthoate polyprenyltransferase, partial [Acidimicrobiales bacterium]